jgi:hypothetical protein
MATQSDTPRELSRIDLKNDLKNDLKEHESPVPSIQEEKGTYMKAGLEEFYVPIERYEGRHRYDPSFTWDPADERKLVRKVRSKIVIATLTSPTPKPFCGTSSSSTR